MLFIWGQNTNSIIYFQIWRSSFVLFLAESLPALTEDTPRDNIRQKNSATQTNAINIEPFKTIQNRRYSNQNLIQITSNTMRIQIEIFFDSNSEFQFVSKLFSIQILLIWNTFE